MVSADIPRVGVTGGMGSGKTTVCRIFHESLGIPVFYADEWAKKLIATDPILSAGIQQIFGPEAYQKEAYNRAYVAKIAFSEPEKLAALNALVHPAVEEASRAWQAEQSQTGAPYTLKEAALLIESGGHRHLDYLIVVTAPEALRLARVKARDGLSEAQILARIRKQLPENEKITLADRVIVNDGEQLLLPQIWAVHHDILLLKNEVLDLGA